jgi:hypothetical protein
MRSRALRHEARWVLAAVLVSLAASPAICMLVDWMAGWL